MKISYKQKLSLYFFIVFVLFTMGIIVFEQSRETGFKKAALTERLDAYTEVIEAALKKHSTVNRAIDELSGLLPENLRITLIDLQGNVLYDNTIEDAALLENHVKRPEIVAAKTDGKGFHIRISTSNNLKYLYYARKNNLFFIRVAFPYDIQIQNLLKSDNLFLYYILILFFITLFLINYVADRFAKSIHKLKEFTLSVEEEMENNPIEFPEDELGEVGRKIIDSYKQLKDKKREIALEREKLLQHVHSSDEGLCFFSSDKKVSFHNALFIRYLNTITDDASSDPETIFKDLSFARINDFLSQTHRGENHCEIRIDKHGKHFTVRINIFEDDSFELIINNITRQEKNRLLKQEMTSNIAHELRTPVTGIRGYLEIALSHPLDKEKAHDFLNKAYKQTIVLSELIQDMNFISKIEESPVSFKREPVDIEALLALLKVDMTESLTEKNIRFQWKNMENTVVQGNRNLIYSIFRNLTDNAVRYAGTGIEIIIAKYNEDREFYYFSYADTGIGIPGNHHLNRLFERFYRVNEGRTRDTGGSGLGLSIVKNAVLFHKGTITVKNRAGGGLEFLFSLPKNTCI